MILNDLKNGVSIAMGVPNNGWFLLGRLPLKWMMTGGTPILGNPQIHHSFCTSSVEILALGLDLSIEAPEILQLTVLTAKEIFSDRLDQEYVPPEGPVPDRSTDPGSISADSVKVPKWLSR